MGNTLFAVEDYVIQRERMMLINAIDQVDEQGAVARSTTTDLWPLFKNGAINPLVIVELVAQTSGISFRWSETQTRPGEKAEGSGLIVGLKKAVFFVDAIPLKATVVTCSTKDYTYINYAEYSGFSKIGEERLGEVTLQVLRTD
ncbi:MAG: hypothetical protein ACLFS7_00630 [Desulfosudaceae bacterium]